MSAFKINKSGLEGNTVIAAAMELFGLKSCKDVEIKIIGNCDIAVINGVAYDWWVDGDFFSFLEA